MVLLLIKAWEWGSESGAVEEEQWQEEQWRRSSGRGAVAGGAEAG